MVCKCPKLLGSILQTLVETVYRAYASSEMEEGQLRSQSLASAFITVSTAVFTKAFLKWGHRDEIQFSTAGLEPGIPHTCKLPGDANVTCSQITLTL